jgi:hypothetical protein
MNESLCSIDCAFLVQTFGSSKDRTESPARAGNNGTSESSELLPKLLPISCRMEELSPEPDEFIQP